MNRTSRTVFVCLLAVGAVSLAAACSSSGNAPAAYGEACTVYATGNPCSGTLLCKCVYQGQEGCFCTQSCNSVADCPHDAGSCLLANDPNGDLTPASFCFEFLPDGGPLH